VLLDGEQECIAVVVQHETGRTAFAWTSSTGVAGKSSRCLEAVKLKDALQVVDSPGWYVAVLPMAPA